MSPFEILPNPGDLQIHITGGTRAGLISAAVKGLFTAMEPQPTEDQTPVDHAFAIDGDSAPDLLVKILNSAISIANTNQQTVDSVTFKLITDRRAEGTFTAHPVASFLSPVKGAKVNDLVIQKNAENLWDTTVVFEA